MPRRNTPRSNVRSGRFHKDDVSGGNKIVIIRPVPGRKYRVFNTGTTRFQVVSDVTILVRPKCSVDFTAPAVDAIEITAPHSNPVSGSYDVIEENDRPRHGRFLLPGNVDKYPVIGRVEGVHRIFNAPRRSNPILLYRNNTLLGSLQPGASMDVGMGANQVLSLTTTGPTRGNYVSFVQGGGRPATDTRSGKINGAGMIVSGASGSRYRIYNSGEDVLNVDYGSGDVPIEAKSSIDVNVPSEASVGAGTGFYEGVQLIARERSGRCRFTAVSDGESRRIVCNATDNYYRILNSSETPFQVRVGATLLPQAVTKEISLDVLPGVGDDIEIVAATAGESVEAIYDALLNRTVDVNSGRFQGIINPASANRRTVIAVGAADPAAHAATYRFLNSGEKELQIYVDSTAQLANGLAKEQSFDLQVAAGANKNILVSAVTAGDHIAGIYEYIHR